MPNSIRLEGSGVELTVTSLRSNVPSAPTFVPGTVVVIEERSKSSDAELATKSVTKKVNGLESPTAATPTGPSTVTPPIVTVSIGVALQG